MKTKEVIMVALAILFICVLNYITGYTSGHIRGMRDQRELTKRVECEIEYGRTAQSLIPGDCLKYFKEK